jgi:hypothetical protein
MCVDGSTYIKKSKKKNKNICHLSPVTCHLRGSLCPLIGDGTSDGLLFLDWVGTQGYPDNLEDLDVLPCDGIALSLHKL